jgi:hypothetical protein
VWASAGPVVASIGHALGVGTAVVVAAVAVFGVFIGWLIRRREYREKAAEAIETTGNVIRDLERLSAPRRAT